MGYQDRDWYKEHHKQQRKKQGLGTFLPEDKERKTLIQASIWIGALFLILAIVLLATH